MRISPAQWSALDLRIHGLTARSANLHDAWAVDLPGGPSGLTLADFKDILGERLALSNVVVRSLFQLRRAMGKAFRWEVEREHKDPPPVFRARLSGADHNKSLFATGTPQGPFRVLYAFPHEAASEIWNATVHAVSCYALVELPTGYRLYLAVYVRSVGRITAPYMSLINPFRRIIIYPALLRAVHTAWSRKYGRETRA